MAAALIFSASASAYDVPSTIFERDGKFSPPRLAAFVASVEPSIREWPARFRNERHESEVRLATSRVVKEINAVDLSGIRDQAVLTNGAHTLSMAHNIDLGSGPKAKETFELAIALNPESRRTNYLFGITTVR